ncbi:LysR family transcriptional regulator [uncultured Ruegeria sp.]|uniref:LysR family transcriptional regulator n=1 Tax=uncultured Ruegeria sp. TaxID=259304 RepID=UPI0026080259|nr:LysR family transcriptional regulator [uncultured Ruegeria sp.]
MKRNQLSDVSIFVEVARTNGFRSAADSLKLKPASVSDAVQRFEDRLGIRLIERTTRSVTLTSAGEQLYRRSLPAITDLEAAVRELDAHKDRVAGTLRISAPYSAGAFFLDDLVSRYATLYPDVSVELIYDDTKVDLAEAKIDVGIRSNTLLEPHTYALPIGPALRMTIVASQAYLEQRGVPTKPEHILDHDGICFAFNRSGSLAPWMFENEDGPFSIMPKPRMLVNDLRSLLSYTKAGLGLAYIYEKVVQADLDKGKLIAVLPGQVSALPRYSLNYHSKRHMPRRLVAFIDMAKSSNTTDS